jgi:phosphatidylglycerophosphatase A
MSANMRGVDARGPNRASLVPTLIATSLGSGFSPLAPGTMGTLTAIPLAWALARGPWFVFWIATVLVSAIGTWAAERFQQANDTDDDQRIVVDEVAGYLVTLLLVPKSGAAMLLAFFLFRLFDIWKPFPVRLIDRKVGGGWGVMADDLAAGVYGALSLFALQYLGVVKSIIARWPALS